MAECYLKDLKKQLPCAVHLDGEYGTKDIYAGVPVIIGSGGVEKIIELKLSKEEKENFKKSVEAVKELFSVAKNRSFSLVNFCQNNFSPHTKNIWEKFNKHFINKI